MNYLTVGTASLVGGTNNISSGAILSSGSINYGTASLAGSHVYSTSNIIGGAILSAGSINYGTSNITSGGTLSSSGVYRTGTFINSSYKQPTPFIGFRDDVVIEIETPLHMYLRITSLDSVQVKKVFMECTFFPTAIIDIILSYCVFIGIEECYDNCEVSTNTTHLKIKPSENKFAVNSVNI